MFTDTHCHISKHDYSDISALYESAKKIGVTKMINNGSDRRTSEEVLKISKTYDTIYAAIGFHPDSVDDIKEEDYDFIENHIDDIVAIGEIGLDYHYQPCNKDRQIEVFKRQLELAKKYNKPVIIHSRDATQDTIDILKEYPTVKGSLHCFSGSLETAKIYIKMGYKLGFNGVVTFKNAKIKDVIKEIPETAILLETDSPYLTPEPYRGKKNEPKNIYYIAKFIAEVRGITLDDLSVITQKNTKSLFDI